MNPEELSNAHLAEAILGAQGRFKKLQGNMLIMCAYGHVKPSEEILENVSAAREMKNHFEKEAIRRLGYEPSDYNRALNLPA